MADKKGRKEPVQTISNTARTAKSEVTPLRPAHAQTQAPAPAQTKGRSKQSPTHEQVAERAWALWIRGGCMPGQDRQNWFEAERQLKAELGIQ
jgi:hypothetical protein